MTYFNEPGSNAGTWLSGTMMRNPEALLVMAAGAMLLMRNGRRIYRPYDAGYGADKGQAWEGGSEGRMGRSVQGRVADAAETAAEYAGELKDTVADTASRYASMATEYSGKGGRRVSAAVSQAVNDQPVLLAAVGVAAGAALAAFLPRLPMEESTFGPARKAIAQVTQDAVAGAKEAASEAGRALQEQVTERSVGALKEAASDAAKVFTNSFSESRSGSGGAGAENEADKHDGSLS